MKHAAAQDFYEPEEDTDVSLFEAVPNWVRDEGSQPTVEIKGDTTSQHDMVCPGCGRPPGPVLKTTSFEEGIDHAVDRLELMMVQRANFSPAEARRITDKIREGDVELPKRRQ